jgi:hypothetical protein
VKEVISSTSGHKLFGITEYTGCRILCYKRKKRNIRAVSRSAKFETVWKRKG